MLMPLLHAQMQTAEDTLQARSLQQALIFKKHNYPGWYLKVNYYRIVNATRFGYKNT